MDGFLKKRERGEDGDTPRKKAKETAPPTLEGWAPPRTPLEQQFMKVKREYPDTILAVETGYKYRFFGKDAEVAGKLLGFYVSKGETDSWCSCSFPVQRLSIHTSRLVNVGYKVGTLAQVETAALRADDGKTSSKLFERGITGLFTRATMILQDEADGQTEAVGGVDDSAHYMMLISEEAVKSEAVKESGDQVVITMLLVSLGGGGSILWDEFTDGLMRRELTTRLMKLEPVEVIVPEQLSTATMNTILALGVNRGLIDPDYIPNGAVRLESKPSHYYHHERQESAVKAFYKDEERVLAAVDDLPKGCVVCLGVLIAHLEPFKLQQLLLRAGRDTGTPFVRFTGKQHMALPGATLLSLEVFKVNLPFGQRAPPAKGRVKGTLNWVVNTCRTGFGARLMRQWISKPLLSLEEIKGRQEAIDEMRDGPVSDTLKEFRNKNLSNVPDIERLLAKVNYGKAQPREFVTLLKTMRMVARNVRDICQCTSDELSELGGAMADLKSSLLAGLLRGLKPGALEEAASKYLSQMNTTAAQANKRNEIFLGIDTTFDEIMKLRKDLEKNTARLDDHLKEVRKLLKLPSLEYKTISQVEYLLDIPTANTKLVPKSWTQISKVAKSVRYHSPEIKETSHRIQVIKDTLMMASARCFEKLQHKFADEYYMLVHDLAGRLAAFDCLFSLSDLTKEDGWCRPTMVDDKVLDIKGGRHPVIDRLLREQEKCYIPNDTVIRDAHHEQVDIITGPNMGGKSSYLRQTALIVLLAQMGSWVPATSATIGLFDAIYVRLGSQDSLLQGQSSFMVEVSETADILRRATERSLLVLDELGRGTSTFDGVALAFATLEWLVHHIRCITLFVTHYPSICELSKIYPSRVKAYHMGFDTPDMVKDDEIRSVVFLYKLRPGVSPSSFGLNVARLAGIPTTVLETAASRSSFLESKQREQQKDKMGLQSTFAVLLLAKELRRLQQLRESKQPGDALSLFQNAISVVDIDALLHLSAPPS